MFSSDLSTALRAVSSGLEIPVKVILVLLMVAAVVQLGSIAAEIFTERRHLKVQLPAFVDALRAATLEELPQVIENSGLLRRQKTALQEILRHPELTDNMRQALAIRLLEQERHRYDVILKTSDLIAKLGPMFGLLGTLIPLGPGVVALGQGDTFTLSASLLTAFDTTVAGLISAAVASVISAVRKGWYNNYMSMLETAMECLVEVCSHDAA